MGKMKEISKIALEDLTAKIAASDKILFWDHAQTTSSGNKRVRFYTIGKRRINGEDELAIHDVTVLVSMLLNIRMVFGGWIGTKQDPSEIVKWVGRDLGIEGMKSRRAF